MPIDYGIRPDGREDKFLPLFCIHCAVTKAGGRGARLVVGADPVGAEEMAPGRPPRGAGGETRCGRRARNLYQHLLRSGLIVRRGAGVPPAGLGQIINRRCYHSAWRSAVRRSCLRASCRVSRDTFPQDAGEPVALRPELCLDGNDQRLARSAAAWPRQGLTRSCRRRASRCPACPSARRVWAG